MIKNYMVLGGSYEQYVYICYLKNEYKNLNIICLDQNKHCFSSDKVDIFYPIDIKNKIRVLKIAKKYKISGLSSVITEHAQSTIQFVSKKMGFPLTSDESVRATNSKSYAKSKILEKNLFVKLKKNNTKLINKLLRENDLVIKPDISSGQRGLTKVSKYTNPKIIIKKINEAIKLSANKNVIIEKYLKGTEVNVVALILDKKIHKFIFSKRLKFNSSNGFGIVYRHEYSNNENLLLKEEIKKYLKKFIEIYKLNNAVLFPQFIFDKSNKLSLIEYGERVPGGKNMEMFFYSTGINLYDVNYRLSLNLNLNLRKFKKNNKYKFISIDFLNGKPGPLKNGKFKEIKFSKNSNLKNIIEHGVFDFKEDGYQEIKNLKTSIDRFYYFITGSNIRFNFKDNISKIFKNSSFLDIKKRSLKRIGILNK